MCRGKKSKIFNNHLFFNQFQRLSTSTGYLANNFGDLYVGMPSTLTCTFHFVGIYFILVYVILAIIVKWVRVKWVMSCVLRKAKRSCHKPVESQTTVPSTIRTTAAWTQQHWNTLKQTWNLLLFMDTNVYPFVHYKGLFIWILLL